MVTLPVVEPPRILVHLLGVDLGPLFGRDYFLAVLPSCGVRDGGSGVGAFSGVQGVVEVCPECRVAFFGPVGRPEDERIPGARARW
jgi:hypothetical protein